MQVENKVHPSNEQMAGFQEPDDGKPVSMVNLLRYRDKAEYEDGRDTNLTGREAYQLYSAGVIACLASVGASITFFGQVRWLMLGEVEDLWDDIAIAQYPSRSAMLEMIMSPEYQEIVAHRDAGLAGQLNIETVNPMDLSND